MVISGGIRLRSIEGRARAPWALIVIGGVAAVMGGVARTIHAEISGVEFPFPSVADILYMPTYLLLGLGQWRFVRARGAGRDPDAWFDALMASGSIAIVGWITVVADFTTDPANALDVRLANVAYVCSDHRIACGHAQGPGSTWSTQHAPLSPLGRNPLPLGRRHGREHRIRAGRRSARNHLLPARNLRLRLRSDVASRHRFPGRRARRHRTSARAASDLPVGRVAVCATTGARRMGRPNRGCRPVDERRSRRCAGHRCAGPGCPARPREGEAGQARRRSPACRRSTSRQYRHRRDRVHCSRLDQPRASCERRMVRSVDTERRGARQDPEHRTGTGRERYGV